MVVMVNHQLGHPAINADILSGNESSLIRAKEHNHICDIHRIADATEWLLQGIRAFPAKLAAIACVSAAIPPFAAV